MNELKACPLGKLKLSSVPDQWKIRPFAMKEFF
jgi:hypothetical protein